jgi:hypothetical protein
MTPQERQDFISDLTKAIQDASTGQELSEQEQQWVRMAIQREAQSIALRRAIIEKSLGGLVWAGIVGLGYVLLDFARNHGIRL